MAVDGPHADAGAACDVLHLRVQPVLREAVAGGRDDLVAVALRVGAERACGDGVGCRHVVKASGTGVPLPLWSMRPGTGTPLHLNRTAGAFPHDRRSPNEGPAVAGARAARRRPVRRRPRRIHRERRPAVHRPRPRLRPGGPLLGHQRVHALLRRLPAAGRSSRRSAGPAQDVHRRPRRLRRSPRSPVVSRRATSGSSPPARCRDSAPRCCRPPRCRCSSRRSPRAPSATRRWASGAPSPARAAPPACCWAACSPTP